MLTVDEGNKIMGSTNMQDLGNFSTTDTNIFQLSIPDCLGAAHIVQAAVYSGSGYNGIFADVQHEPGQRYTHSIEQAAVSFPTADEALAFVNKSVGEWRSCNGKSVSDVLNGSSMPFTFGNEVGDPPKISILYNRQNARGWACQHTLSAVLNVVIDVKACSFKVADQGIDAADKMAAKVTA